MLFPCSIWVLSKFDEQLILGLVVLFVSFSYMLLPSYSQPPTATLPHLRLLRFIPVRGLAVVLCCRISGSGKTLEVRTLGCARRSLLPLAHALTAISRLSASNSQNKGTQDLYWFGPPMWCNTLLQCGVVDCLSG